MMGKICYYAFLVFTKIWAPVYFLLVARHFRAKARSAVYNMVVLREKRHRLKRLWERKPTLYARYNGNMAFHLFPVFPVHGGYFERGYYGKVTTWLYFWLVWVWCDDDSVSDTYDDGHCRTFIDGERKDTWQAKVFGKWLDIPCEVDSKAFDHGDITAPRFKWIPALIWNYRNTTMNFKYYFGNY